MAVVERCKARHSAQSKPRHRTGSCWISCRWGGREVRQRGPPSSPAAAVARVAMIASPLSTPLPHHPSPPMRGQPTPRCHPSLGGEGGSSCCTSSGSRSGSGSSGRMTRLRSSAASGAGQPRSAAGGSCGRRSGVERRWTMRSGRCAAAGGGGRVAAGGGGRLPAEKGSGGRRRVGTTGNVKRAAACERGRRWAAAPQHPISHNGWGLWRPDAAACRCRAQVAHAPASRPGQGAIHLAPPAVFAPSDAPLLRHPAHL